MSVLYALTTDDHLGEGNSQPRDTFEEKRAKLTTKKCGAKLGTKISSITF